MNEPMEPQDPFERELGEGMDRLVRHELPPYDLAARAQARAGAMSAASRRRALVRGGGVVALAAAAVWAVAVVGAGDGGRPAVRTADDPNHPSYVAPTSTTSSSTTSTTLDGDDDGTDRREDDQVGPTTSTAVGAGPVSDPAPEPRCATVTGEPNTVRSDWAARGSSSGPAAYWRTQPAQDKPITIKVCIDDVTPKVGQTVTVTVTADDPDQVFIDGSCNRLSVSWERTEPVISFCNDGIPPPPETPADTPEPGPAGHAELTDSYVYTAAGPQTVIASATSGRDTGAPEPYRSRASVQLPITVHE